MISPRDRLHEPGTVTKESLIVLDESVPGVLTVRNMPTPPVAEWNLTARYEDSMDAASADQSVDDGFAIETWRCQIDDLQKMPPMLRASDELERLRDIRELESIRTQRIYQWAERTKNNRGRPVAPITRRRVDAIKEWINANSTDIDIVAKECGRGATTKRGCQYAMTLRNSLGLFGGNIDLTDGSPMAKKNFDHAWRMAVAELRAVAPYRMTKMRKNILTR